MIISSLNQAFWCHQTMWPGVIICCDYCARWQFCLQITPSNYPQLFDTQLFPPTRFVQTGSTVKFRCAAEHVALGGTKFYINGEEVTEGTLFNMFRYLE